MKISLEKTLNYKPYRFACLVVCAIPLLIEGVGLFWSFIQWKWMLGNSDLRILSFGLLFLFIGILKVEKS